MWFRFLFFIFIVDIKLNCRLYDKLAGNSLAGESRIGGADIEIDLEEEPDSEQGHIETWKEGIDNRIGKSAFQQASRLLEAVNKTLDGLEDGLVKHAEVLFPRIWTGAFICI